MEMARQPEPPARLCCGQKHWGVVCPDGLVMCQLCFERVPISKLHLTENGQPEDVCSECAAIEIETEANHTNWRMLNE